jgi:hypothetical protein
MTSEESTEEPDLGRKIQDRFQSDYKNILRAHMDDLEGLFQFHEDGATELQGEYRELAVETQILIYLIAQRYKAETPITEEDSVPYSEIYPRFPDKDDSTVRGYFMNLRKEGFAKKDGDGHRFVVERLPDAVERIESEPGED